MTNQTCLTDKLLYHTVEQGYNHLHRIVSIGNNSSNFSKYGISTAVKVFLSIVSKEHLNKLN